MIKLGICNELFEGWEFPNVCRTVKALGYDGLEIAPFTLAARIMSQRRAAPDAQGDIADSGLATIGLHWLLARTEGFYLTTPSIGPATTGNYLLAGRGNAGPGRLAAGAGFAQAAAPVAGRDL